MNKDYLLYELNMYRRKLELGITAAEQQLASVNKRLHNLSQDLYIYLAFLTVPIPVYLVFHFLSLTPVRIWSYMIFTAVKFSVLVIYLVMLPPNIYRLTKTIILLWINRETDEQVLLPPIQGKSNGGKALDEESYRSERDRLVRVLGRYYIYREKLEKLFKKVNDASCNMTRIELEYKLSQLPIYEDIQPANPLTGTMGAQVKAKTKKIMCAIVLAILISLLIGIFG